MLIRYCWISRRSFPAIGHHTAVRQGDKAAALREARIGEVWIVNLVDRVVEIHRDPSNGAYRVKIERGADDTAAPVALPDVKLRLADIL